MKKLILIAIIAMNALTGMSQTAKTIKLKFVETSDVHGCFFPYDFTNQRERGGSLARINHYVDQLRKTDPGVILLENGDILQGQPINYFSNFVDTTHVNIAARLIKYMKYDAHTWGNHDIETGHSVYDAWAANTGCPTLSANIIDTRTGKNYTQPYAVFERQGIKIGVIGMLTPAIPSWLSTDLWSNLKFLDMVETARKYVKILKEQEHADVIVGLFHSGRDGGIHTDDYDEDQTYDVARHVPGFDLIFYGHDHTRNLEWINREDGGKVLILNPANNAMYVAEADVEVTVKDSVITDKKVEGRIVDVRNTPVDETMVSLFQNDIDLCNNFVRDEIGYFARTIDTHDSFFGSSAFTDFIHRIQLEMTGADISINAPLSFNATIKKGPVHVSDMFNLYRYENKLCVLLMTGEEILKHLERSYDLWANTMKSKDDYVVKLSQQTLNDNQRYGFTNLTFNFDSAAGIEYEVDVTKPDGKKVTIKKMSDGRKFDPEATYKVAMNSYRANGGGELLTKGAGIPASEIPDRVIYRSKYDQRHYIIEYIKKHKNIDPKPLNNWRFVPKKWTKKAIERDKKLIFGKLID